MAMAIFNPTSYSSGNTYLSPFDDCRSTVPHSMSYGRTVQYTQLISCDVFDSVTLKYSSTISQRVQIYKMMIFGNMGNKRHQLSTK